MRSNQKGFTLIELLVAMTLFVVFISIASGVFVRVLRSQRIIASLITVNDNASLTIEQMAREIRVGTHFSAPMPTRLDFINARNQSVSYRLNSESLERKSDTEEFQPITSGNVRIERLNFIVSGTGAGDKKQPQITIVFSVGSSYQPLEGFLTNIQTTISPRELDS